MFRRCPLGTDLVELCLFSFLATQLGCQRGSDRSRAPRIDAGEARIAPPFQLEAKWFEYGGDIPREFICDGVNSSPGLTWAQPPAGSRRFALIMEGPAGRAGGSIHWVDCDVPSTARELPEAMAARDEPVDGSRQGLNGFGKLGYSAPCPPPGTTARYSFKLFALDPKLKLKARATKEDVERAMAGHVLGQAVLVGFYSRHRARPRK